MEPQTAPVSKLALAATILLCLMTATPTSCSRKSLLTVEDGVYSGLTVKIDDAVPRHLCFRVVNQLEVRTPEVSL